MDSALYGSGFSLKVVLVIWDFFFMALHVRDGGIRWLVMVVEFRL